jgi:hypothetical protein
VNGLRRLSRNDPTKIQWRSNVVTRQEATNIILGTILFVVLLVMVGMYLLISSLINPPARHADTSDAETQAILDCARQMTFLENDVFSSMSFSHENLLASVTCDKERKVLDVLATIPKDQRDEVFDHYLDGVRAGRGER